MHRASRDDQAFPGVVRQLRMDRTRRHLVEQEQQQRVLVRYVVIERHRRRAEFGGRAPRMLPDGRIFDEQRRTSGDVEGWTLATFRVATDADVHGDHWEMHPSGEELVALLSGGIRMYLREAGDAAEPVSLREDRRSSCRGGIGIGSRWMSRAN